MCPVTNVRFGGGLVLRNAQHRQVWPTAQGCSLVKQSTYKHPLISRHIWRVVRENRHRVLAQSSDGPIGSEKRTGRQWKWAAATVVENRSESANGALRSLTLSVQDHVTILEGRKMGRKPKDARWVDALTVPGQFVGLCEGNGSPDSLTADAQPTKVLAIASSPYDAKRNSAMLDAALVEVLVDRGAGDELETRLGQLAPGAVVHVTQVIGSGFGTLFSEGEGLSVAMEEGHDLVMIGAGTQGLASLRACVEWTPVQAHASTRAVSLFILADSPQAVAYVKDFDQWRASGVRVHPIYCHPQQLAQNNGAGAALSPRELLERELFPIDAMGKPADVYARACTVLMSGLTPDLMKSLTKQLIQRGVPVQNILCAGDL